MRDFRYFRYKRFHGRRGVYVRKRRFFHRRETRLLLLLPIAKGPVEGKREKPKKGPSGSCKQRYGERSAPPPRPTSHPLIVELSSLPLPTTSLSPARCPKGNVKGFFSYLETDASRSSSSSVSSRWFVRQLMKPSPVMSVFTCQHMEKEKTRTYTCLLEGRGGSAREGKGKMGKASLFILFPFCSRVPSFPLSPERPLAARKAVRKRKREQREEVEAFSRPGTDNRQFWGNFRISGYFFRFVKK